MSATPQDLAINSAVAAEPMDNLIQTSFWRDARLAWRLLTREWHSGELRVLVAALLVAVAGITAVGFFVDRIEGAMEGRASQLLASDLLVTSRDPIPDEMEAKAKARGLATARTLTMRSVVLAGESMRLTEVKAVTQGYPLRGTLMDSDEPFGQGQVTDEVPAPGTAWLEGRLLAALGLKVGDTFDLGAASFIIDRVLISEPDRGGQLFNIAPRVMVNMNDV
ncbi:MAG: ABC transporter permease, partial [Gammaproteobacteria bacterium]